MQDRDGRTTPGSAWKVCWQRSKDKETGEEEREAVHKIGQEEVEGARVWGGGEFEEGKAVEKGKIRAWFRNIRRFKMDNSNVHNVVHINEIKNRMWRQSRMYGVAVSGLADTGLPVGPGKQDHLSLLHKAGQMGAQARRHWGGDRMRWTVSNAGEGKGEETGMLGGGTSVAVHEKWN